MEKNWKNKRKNVMHGVYRNKFYRLINDGGVKFGKKELNEYTYYDFAFLLELLREIDKRKYGEDEVHAKLVGLMDEDLDSEIYKTITDTLGVNFTGMVDAFDVAGAYILTNRKDKLMYQVVQLWWKYFKSHQHRWGIAYVDIGQEREVERNVKNIESLTPNQLVWTISYMWD